jgi:toxin ParE1/3/4
LGQDFVTEVSGQLKRVAESPEAYSPWPANGKFRRALLQRFPYVVFFMDEEDAIYVYAIAHAKQRPGYWARRRR